MKIDNPRTDIVTRGKHPKEDLFRVVLREGVARVSDTLPGRGYYVLRDEKAIKALSPKHFRGKIGLEEVERLRKDLYDLL